jgi:PKHD-type hydroxylase
LSKQLGEMILYAVARHPLFFSAALPLKSVPPLFKPLRGR